METFFAPGERKAGEPLIRELEFVSDHSLVVTLLEHVGGAFAVLNKERQVLAVNHHFLKSLGIQDTAVVPGLRLGEVLGCKHSNEMPGGCGTSKACSSCDVAVATVTALGSKEAAERTCCMTVERNGVQEDLFLRVRASPIMLNGHALILLFLQDMTYQQKWTMMERVFFHDLNNLISGLTSVVELMRLEPLTGEAESLSQTLEHISVQLDQEISLQRLLLQQSGASYRPLREPLLAENLLEELVITFSRHPSADGKLLRKITPAAGLRIVSDRTLLSKIIGNMVINALEASDSGSEIRFGCDSFPDSVSFWVWNPGFIPPQTAVRIFQRNFSTKADIGRGLGTYSMQLFGEGFLKGKVGFSTSPEDGTRFYLNLPAGGIP